ncbi:MAG TPA: helix-turn-helix domain-containing protein [Nocardioidaceae bacterium]|nr:helix-turn-helix domain-containing protein [Nocardioidaceae bacterium]
MSADAAPPRRRRPYAARVPLEERREQLFDAALRVIARDGYEGVTLAAVADEAGVTKPVLYTAFRSLSELLTELLDRQQARALMQLFNGLPADPSVAPDELVARTVRAWVAAVKDEPAVWRAILLAGRRTPEVVWARIAEGRELLRVRLAELLAEQVGAAGETRLDPDLMAHALIAMAERFGQLLLTEPEKVDVERLVPMAQAFLSLVRPPQTR